MSQRPSGAMGQALVAAAVVLGTGPLALALLVLVVSRSGAEGLAPLFQEGGVFSYGVLLAGAVASLIGAVIAGVSVRRPAFPMAVALVPFVLVHLVALLGAAHGATQIRDAIVHVSALDRPIILVAGSGELLSLSLQALAFSAAGALAVAAAALLTLGAPGRGGRALTLVGALLLGASLLASAMQSAALKSAFMVTSKVELSSRAALVAGAVETWLLHNRLSSMLLLGVFALALVGGALVARTDRALGITTAFALLVAAVGLRGFDALALRRVLEPARDIVGSLPKLHALHGAMPSRGEFVSLVGSNVIDADVARQVGHDDLKRPVALELRVEVTREALSHALATAHYLDAEVELVGQGRRFDREGPPQFEPVLELLRTQRTAVGLRVLYAEERCEGCAGPMTLEGDALVGGNERWTLLEDDGAEREAAKLTPVDFDWTRGSPETLARAAEIAWSHRAVLVARVPKPEQPPELPAY